MSSIFRRAGRTGVTLKYRDARGRWRMRSYPTRTPAEEAGGRLEATGRLGAPLLRDYAPAWLARNAKLLRDNTVRIALTSELYGRWLPAGDRAAVNWLEGKCQHGGHRSPESIGVAVMNEVVARTCPEPGYRR